MSLKRVTIEGNLATFAEKIDEKKRQYFDRMSKTAQTLLTYFFIELLFLGRYELQKNQRILAEKFSKHYNSIYNAIRGLQTRGYIQCFGQNKQTKISIELTKGNLPTLLALIDNTFMGKLLENNLHGQLEEKKAEEQEKIRDRSVDLQRQAKTLLEQSNYLAKQLTQDILLAVADLMRTTYQEIDFEDYFITIMQIFQQIPEYLGEPSISRNKFLRPQQVAITYKKRGRM